MKKTLLIICFLVGFLVQNFAQVNKDFILTLNQDTLYGEITIYRDKSPIIFKYHKKKMRYHPNTLQAFGILENDEYHQFKSLKSQNGIAVFAQLMTEGPLYLYKYREQHVYSSHTLERYVYFLGESDKNLTTLSSSSYKRILGQLFNKYPNFLAKLNASSFSEVPKIISFLNQELIRNLGRK